MAQPTAVTTMPTPNRLQNNITRVICNDLISLTQQYNDSYGAKIPQDLYDWWPQNKVSTIDRELFGSLDSAILLAQQIPAHTGKPPRLDECW